MNEFDLRKFLYNNPLMEKKEDSKKGNKEMQKRMKGAIEDDADHIEDLKKDIKANKKKLAKLKKDEPMDVNEMKKQGYDDREDESLGARRGAEKDKKQSMKDRRDDSYGKFGKRDAEKKGKNKINKEGMYSDDDRDDIPGTPEFETEYDIDPRNNRMMTREGLKDMIREKITSILNEETIDEGDNYYEDVTEQEDDEVNVDVKKDVNIDVKDEVDVDDESVESDVEVKTSVPGADKDTSEVLGLLTKASEASDAFTDDPELKTQIGNTITYFTRKHVAKV